MLSQCRVMQLLALILLLPQCLGMQIHRHWSTQHWCNSVVNPSWPFAYSKYIGQQEETKGRVSTNKQDVRHECDARGVQSKCHICEDIVCGAQKNQTCYFQLQGLSWQNDINISLFRIAQERWMFRQLRVIQLVFTEIFVDFEMHFLLKTVSSIIHQG